MNNDSECEELVILETMKTKEKSGMNPNISGEVFVDEDCVILSSNMDANAELALSKSQQETNIEHISKKARIEDIQISIAVNSPKKERHPLGNKKNAKTKDNSRTGCNTALENTGSDEMHACPGPGNNMGVTSTQSSSNKSSAALQPESPNAPESYKYIIRFKSGAFEKDFYMNDDDPVETLYRELFGSNTEKRLLYEDMKLSRFLLAGESGFFPGVNYVYLPENETLGMPKKMRIVLKLCDDPSNDIVVQISSDYTVSDLLHEIKESKDIDISKKVVVFNGEALSGSQLLASILEDEYVLDVIDSSLIG